MNIAETRTPTVLDSPINRTQYVTECQANVARFKETYPLHWIEYIRGKCPANRAELLKLKKWVATSSSILVDSRPVIPLIHQLVDERLQDYRRPRGVAVAAIVLGKLYVSYSLCNFAAGDQWNRSIGIWKAMQRITDLKILPSPTVKVDLDQDAALVPVECEPGDYSIWISQFPSSSHSTVIRLTRRIELQLGAKCPCEV